MTPLVAYVTVPARLQRANERWQKGVWLLPVSPGEQSGESAFRRIMVTVRQTREAETALSPL